MGRRAKDAAQKKISEWTGTSVHRNVSKSETKTTTKNENTSASIENRNPLQSHSQSEINAMKNCTVRLEKIPIESKKMGRGGKTPVKTTPSANIEIKDKSNAAKNVYDEFSFEAEEISLATGQEDAMKDLIDKLARENKIEVKKYRPKVGKKKKPDPKDPVKKTAIQKRRREKQPMEIEPPQKKPNLKTKVTETVKQKNVAISSNIVTKSNKQSELDKLANNNNSAEKVGVTEPKKTVTAQTAINTEHINAQPRLRNRNLNHINDFQSTPKSSTPLGKNATPTNKENNRSLNSLFFNSASPLISSTRMTRGDLVKQRLQLSAIEDSQEEASTSTAQINVDNNAAPQIDFNDDDFDFAGNMEPAADPEVDKENSLDRPSTSANAQISTNSNQNRMTVSTTMENRPGTSTSRDQPSTSSAVSTPLRNANNQSVFDIQNTSDYHIFSPTKRRVYGRSPLKNITSEVNNTNSPSFESAKSIPATIPRSFGSLAKSTLNSIQTETSKELDITLPEASYFSSRRAADDFDRSITNQHFVEDCFGFDVGDDEDIDSNNDTLMENVSASKSQVAKEKERQLEAEKSALKEIRARLKRFLHNPETTDETAKKTKVDRNDRLRKKKVNSPMKSTAKSPAKTVKTPVKRHVVFGEIGGKQKDIRNAFTAKADSDKRKKPDDGPDVLFGEVETVQDRRRSYSRPQRQRKRRISIDTDESEEEEEPQSDDEELNADGKSKRAKRRKKNTAPNPKEQEELNEFLEKTNAHFAEVETFPLIIE